MKRFLTIAGICIIVIACIRLFYNSTEFTSFTQYEKGFVTGNVLLVILGIALIYFSRKRKSRS